MNGDALPPARGFPPPPRPVAGTLGFIWYFSTVCKKRAVQEYLDAQRLRFDESLLRGADSGGTPESAA